LSFVRVEGEERLFCAFNLSDAAVSYSPPAGLKVLTRVGDGDAQGRLGAFAGLIGAF
jgi:hypothetical protein